MSELVAYVSFAVFAVAGYLYLLRRETLKRRREREADDE